MVNDTTRLLGLEGTGTAKSESVHMGAMSGSWGGI